MIVDDRSGAGGSPAKAGGPYDDVVGLDADFLRKLEYLNLVARRILAGVMRADRKSPRKGVSAEFADHRPYTPGDDYRHVDWHLFGRLEELFLKLYREEENLHLTVLLDTSLSMKYGAAPTGNARTDKFGYGLQVAAALGYIGMANMDSVNVVPFGQGCLDGLWGQKGKSRVFPLLEFLRGVRPGGETDLARSCREFILRERRRGIVIVVSDFYDLDGIETAIKYLQYPRNEVYVIQVRDASELDPPLRGDLRLADAETGAMREINITDGLLKKYRAAIEELATRVETYCNRREIGYVLARTEIPFDQLVLLILRRGGLVA